jgi:signal transduction histidine kinase
MKRIKEPESISSEKPDTGFWGRVEWAVILVLFPVFLILTFHSMGYGGVMEPLMLPFTMAIAVGAGLRFRVAGTLAIAVLLLLVIAFAWGSKLGVYAEGGFGGHLLFSVGLVILFVSITLLSSIVVGYHLRTAEMANVYEHLMHRVLDALPIGVWVRSRDGRTVFINERWASFSPMSVSEIMSSGSQAPPVDLGVEWEAERLELLSSDDASIHYQHIDLVDNRERPCSMTLLTLRVYIDETEGEGTLSLLVDETALRLYEEQVRDSEHRLRMALDTVEMGFWEQDLRSGEIFRDANWSRILEVDTSEVHDERKEWQGRIHPDDRDRVLAAYMGFLGNGEDPLEIDYRIRRGASDYIWVQDRVIVQHRDAAGRASRIMGTMQDISARKRIELDLKQAKDRAEAGNQAKGHFIATISHEIRTPLNAIIGLSSFLNESELDEEQLDLSQTIYASGKSLLLLVNDILDFSKIEAGRLDLETQEFPLQLCFEESVKLFKIRAAERNVALRLTLDPSLTEFAMGDMERLRQIVQNLLANALKFTNVGEVEIAVRPVKLSELPVERRPDELEPVGYLDQVDHDYIEVLVSDTGIGIPKDRQHVLFEAFSQVDASTTRQYGGTGLGLAICKRLVHAMGGKIWLESCEGEGAVFGFVVRTKLIGEATEVLSDTTHTTEQVERIVEEHPCDILVVGDREETASLLLACRQLGYSPHHAPNYDLSADAFQRRSYNIVFIGMGNEAAALELSRQICASTGSKRPQAVLGVVPAEQVVSKERCKLVGMQRLIEGELSSATIREVILDVLHEHG